MHPQHPRIRSPYDDDIESPDAPLPEGSFWHGDFNPYRNTRGASGHDPYYGALGYRDIEDEHGNRYTSRESHSGRVTTTFQLTRAQRLHHGPKGYRRSDERIADDLYVHLSQRSDIDPSDVTISVEGGNVNLAGWVPERYMRYAVEDVAANCPGVRDVHNAIRVGPPPT